MLAAGVMVLGNAMSLVGLELRIALPHVPAVDHQIAVMLILSYIRHAMVRVAALGKLGLGLLAAISVGRAQV